MEDAARRETWLPAVLDDVWQEGYTPLADALAAAEISLIGPKTAADAQDQPQTPDDEGLVVVAGTSGLLGVVAFLGVKWQVTSDKWAVRPAGG